MCGALLLGHPPQLWAMEFWSQPVKRWEALKRLLTLGAFTTAAWYLGCAPR